MSFFSWLRNRTSIPSPRGRGQHRLAAPRFRPRLEALEERTLLSTYTAATASDLIVDIDAANKHGGTNTITLTAPTTSPYVLTAVDNSTNGANGLPVIKKGDNLTIVGNGDTIERSSSSTSAFRLFDVASGSSLTLEDVTLQGGFAGVGLGAATDGGAIYNQGTLILSGATVQDNFARGTQGFYGYINKKGNFVNAQPGGNAEGGGIWSSSAVTLQDLTLSQNGTTTTIHTLLQSNEAAGGTGGSGRGGSGGAGGSGLGGGLYQAAGSVTVSNATLAGNYAVGGNGANISHHSGIIYAGEGGAGSGGGLYVAGGTLDMSSGNVESNEALGGNGGGGSDFTSRNGVGGTGSGGGVYVAGGTVNLAKVGLLSNTAEGGNGGDSEPTPGATGGASGAQGGNGFGGALYVAAGTATLTNDTVTGNYALGGWSQVAFPGAGPGAGEGGGIFIDSVATVYLDPFTVANTVNNYSGSVENGAYNIDNIDGTYTLV